MAVMFFVVCCFAKGTTTSTVFTVEPPMTCQNCENKIKTNLRFEKGVTDIATDIKAATVTVTYDPAKTNDEKIIEAFGKIGYKANAATENATGTTCTPAQGACNGCCKH